MKKFIYSFILLSIIPIMASANSSYRCVVFDSAIDAKRADEKVVVIKQAPHTDKAQYIGKKVVLDFNFSKDSPMTVEAHDSKVDKGIEFTKTFGSAEKFHGYIADYEIEINCKKRPN